jgi:hypothetical protein
MKHKPVMFGSARLTREKTKPRGKFETIDGRTWYRISDFNRMPPFFMTITNPDDIWMFIATTGGITAGRKDCDSALFPYTTVDRVIDGHTTTGGYSAVLVEGTDSSSLWEPLSWSTPCVYDVTKSIRKDVYGNAVVFEERNNSLEITFRSGWESCSEFGIHRFSSITNNTDKPLKLKLLDGIRNILPAGATELLQRSYSNLLDAYKRGEGDPHTGLATFSLSATLTDQAEPSECLRTTTVWSYGLEDAKLMVSENQLDDFRYGETPTDETDIKGQRGAYFRMKSVELNPGETMNWGMVADLEQDHVSVNNLKSRLADNRSALVGDLHSSLSLSRNRLEKILRDNDAIQDVESLESRYHHLANVMFNVMRGGYFLSGYSIQSQGFMDFVGRWNSVVGTRFSDWLKNLPAELPISDLVRRCRKLNDPDLRRLALEYLPLTFSRRHGDPSRPWNRFSIETRSANDEPVVGYQGNWRDIFQNWEALCLSYPMYFPSIVVKFLNATTIDGYNPYRISQDGIDWEVPEPDNPWSNIGYWSDHQIVYLTKILEHVDNILPGEIDNMLNSSMFVYAEVPYRIKSFEHLLSDPFDSIEFDDKRDAALRVRKSEIGADGFLLSDNQHQLVRGTMAEKLLILLLAKAANYVPGGGIWMNTQRPEWNDANNALAGWGLSVVTLSYLLRYLKVLDRLFAKGSDEKVSLHAEVALWMENSITALSNIGPEASGSPEMRYKLLADLGTAAGTYRAAVYDGGFSGEMTTVDCGRIRELTGLCGTHFRQTLLETRWEDGTFESYQTLRIDDGRAEVKRLYPMLEGQVAGLSSGVVDPEEAVSILHALKNGPLYRADQHSYMLYPNRDIPGFLEKNSITEQEAEKLTILNRGKSDWEGLLRPDSNGNWHFDGRFRNVKDLRDAAARFPDKERIELEELFERIFRHEAFTGRSGTFFAYEGLGSIYWHMVSKLLLAVQEILVQTAEGNTDQQVIRNLKDRYNDIRNGLGFNKEPHVYGAFPTDPYSHSPWGRGAKQPGMTGQVKEEILTRFAELGLVIRNGKIGFLPELILDDQWHRDRREFAFMFCGVNFEVAEEEQPSLEVRFTDGSRAAIDSAGAPAEIPADISEDIFARNGRVQAVKVGI